MPAIAPKYWECVDSLSGPARLHDFHAAFSVRDDLTLCPSRAEMSTPERRFAGVRHPGRRDCKPARALQGRASEEMAREAEAGSAFPPQQADISSFARLQ